MAAQETVRYRRPAPPAARAGLDREMLSRSLARGTTGADGGTKR